MLPRLQVSANCRYLVREDGRPFFYLADTAWELFHRLSREDAAEYLDRRASQGFTAIQCVLLAEEEGLDVPNAHGRRPLRNNDPADPDISPGSEPGDPAQYDYWDHVAYLLEAMLHRGLYPAVLPTWGSHVNSGPFTVENAAVYGEFLGRRYGHLPVVWVLGGDRDPTGYESVWHAMARGLALGARGREEYDTLLMTFHPRGGGTSSTWFHRAPWLGFNMQQNGHGINTPVWERIGADYAREPVKPVMDGEPLYEDHPIAFNAARNGYSTAYEVRKFAYWDLFSGAHGHTYGHHSVWQMYQEGRKPVNGPLCSWREALGRPGALQMRHVRALMESRPFLTRAPDQQLLACEAGTDTWRLQATRCTEGSFCFVYSAAGRPVTVDLATVQGPLVRTWWYDPRDGAATLIGELPATGEATFTPPSRGAGHDWVLVVDEAARGFPPPGQSL